MTRGVVHGSALSLASVAPASGLVPAEGEDRCGSEVPSSVCPAWSDVPAPCVACTPLPAPRLERAWTLTAPGSGCLLLLRCALCWSSVLVGVAAVAKHRKLDILKQQTYILSHFWRPESGNQVSAGPQSSNGTRGKVLPCFFWLPVASASLGGWSLTPVSALHLCTAFSVSVSNLLLQ